MKFTQSPILTEYLSPLLLIIAALILPVIIAWTSTFLPYKTMSEQNHSIMWKVYLFLLLMVLILPSLGLTRLVIDIMLPNRHKLNFAI